MNVQAGTTDDDHTIADDAIAQLEARFATPSTITDWSWLPKSDWSCHDAAVAYAKHGFTTVLLYGTYKNLDGNTACSCRLGVDCSRKGKHPRYRDWTELPGDDPEVVSAWFGHFSNSNVGIVTGGRSRVFALDVDPKNGGLESLAKLEAKNGKLPVTLTARTPSGGEHRYYHVPDGLILARNSESKIAPGIDVRCDGGLVVAPPSRTENGQYAWLGVI